MTQVGTVFVGLVAAVVLLLWLSEMQWASDLRYWLFRLISKRTTDDKVPVVSLPVLDKGSTRGPSVPRHYLSMPVRDMFLAQRFERLPKAAGEQKSAKPLAKVAQEPLKAVPVQKSQRPVAKVAEGAYIPDEYSKFEEKFFPVGSEANAETIARKRGYPRETAASDQGRQPLSGRLDSEEGSGTGRRRQSSI